MTELDREGENVGVDARVLATRRPLSALRRFVRGGAGARASAHDGAAERCETCAAPIAAEHAHLFESATRGVSCACMTCARLLTDAPDARFRRIEPRAERLDGFALTDAEWADLGIPVALAYFYRSSAAGSVLAVFPSPLGGAEAPVAEDAWIAIASRHPALAGLAPDVEALLASRLGGPGAPRRHYAVSIDACFRLAGILRREWRGLSGGGPAWQSITAFFDGLEASGAPHATADLAAGSEPHRG